MIHESELILNSKGAIYHLDLVPGEVADTIITVGDPGRVAEVSKYFQHVELKRERREFVTHTGDYNNKRITVISTGIGTDNVDIVLNEVDALVNINFETRHANDHIRSLKIIRIGTSGSLQGDIPVDSFVASEFAIGMDNLMNFYQRDYSDAERELVLTFTHYMHQKQISFLPYASCASASLLDAIAPDLFRGITVTAPGFYGPQGRVLRGKLAFNGLMDSLAAFSMGSRRITNFEMETAGIYGVASMLGHEALSISTVVVNRVTKKFSRDHEASVNRLIQLVLSRIAGETLA